MKNKNLIVCDTEEEYAKALAEFFMQKKEFRFQVHVCSSLEHANSLGRTFQADILVSAAEHVKKMQEKLQAKRVFVLGTGKGAESLGYPVLYKYQSGEALLREIIQKCSDLFEEEEMPRNMAGAGKRKIIGVFSPVHRIGKTEYALSLGEKMAESENVLYLNLEIFSGAGERFGGNAQTLTDVLYYARQEKGNVGLILTTLVCHRGNLDYIQPMPVSEDVKEVSGTEWAGLFRKILEQSIYETLILDIDEGIPGLYHILKCCTEIHMPVTEDRYSQAKLRQFEHEASLLGHVDVLKKIFRKGGTS